MRKGERRRNNTQQLRGHVVGGKTRRTMTEKEMWKKGKFTCTESDQNKRELDGGFFQLLSLIRKDREAKRDCDERTIE